MNAPVTIIKTEQTTITLGNEGIMRYSYNYPNVHEEFEEARVVMEAIKKFLRGKRVLMLVDITNLGFMSPPARAHHAGPESAESCYAAAVLVKTTFARLLSNFYLSTTEQMFPTKAFTDEKKAIAWLRTQRVETQSETVLVGSENRPA